MRGYLLRKNSVRGIYPSPHSILRHTPSPYTSHHTHLPHHSPITSQPYTPTSPHTPPLTRPLTPITAHTTPTTSHHSPSTHHHSPTTRCATLGFPSVGYKVVRGSQSQLVTGIQDRRVCSIATTLLSWFQLNLAARLEQLRQ